jgi:hypothetical protein
LHTYTLVIKKDDVILEFKSGDPTIVEKELGAWIKAAQEAFESGNYTPFPEEKQPQKIEIGTIDLDAKPEPVKAPEPEIKEPEPIIVKEAPKPKIEPIVEQKPQNNYTISEKTKEILQRAIHKPAPRMEEALKPEPQEIPKAPEPIEVISEEQEEQNLLQTPPQEDFTAIFNQKIVHENTSTDKFAQLLSLQNIHSKLDCLIACAFHLVERENFERFTLKQINTLSKALMEEAIEHDTVKEALEKRYIKIVPDYTGIATTMEYTLTEQGVRYFNDQIAE